jgi:hypothetical protein
MANTLKFKRGLLAGLPTAAEGEPLFTTDSNDLYIGTSTGNQRFQKYIASGATTQILRGDGSLYSFPLAISSPSNGQVLKFNGTNWVNDSDAGITGSGSAGQVAYFTGATTQGGSNNLFWDSTNNRLGVGTNSPQYKLDVQGTSNTVAIRAASNTANDILYYATGTVTGQLNAFLTAINATGAVSGALLNNNSATGSAFLDINVTAASTGDPYLSLTTSGATNWSIGIDNSDSDKLKIGPNSNPSIGTSSMTMFTTGNIAIGSNSDTTQKLQVNGTSIFRDDMQLSKTTASLAELIINDGFTSSTTTEARIRVQANSTQGYIIAQGPLKSAYKIQGPGDLSIYKSGTDGNITILNDRSTGNILMAAGGSSTAHLTINASGNLGIGVVPTVRLDVAGPSNLTSRARFEKTGTGKILQLGADRDTSLLPYIGTESNHGFSIITNNLEVARFDATGNLGISTTTLSGKLTIGGDNNQLFITTTGTFSSLYFNVGANNRGAFYVSDTQTRVEGRGSGGLILGGATSQTHLTIASTGVATFSSSVTGGSFIPTSAIVPTNGMYLSTTNTLAFSTGSSERLRIDSAGNVAIGITTAAGKLHAQQPIATVSSTTLGNNTAVGLNITAPDTALAGGEGIAFALGMNGRGRSYLANIHISTSKDACELAFYNTQGAVILERMRIKTEGQVRFVPLSSAPVLVQAGDVYYDSTTNKLRCYNGTSWNDLF